MMWSPSDQMTMKTTSQAMERGEEAETDGAEGGQDHGRRGHLGLPEDGEHGAGDEDEKEPRQFARKLDPAAGLGPEVVDLGEVVVEGGHR